MKTQIKIHTNGNKQVLRTWVRTTVYGYLEMYETARGHIQRFNKEMEIFGAAAAAAIRN